jgi:lauroyl/myristoyl acyltransferase
MKLIGKGDLASLLFIPLTGSLTALGSGATKDALVRSIAAADFRFSTRKRVKSEARLRRALAGSLAEGDIPVILKESFYEFWREPFSWRLCRDERAGLGDMEVSGLDRLRSALAAGTGAILWESSAFGRRALSKHILHAHGVFVCQLHAEHHLGGLLTGTWLRDRIVRPFFDRCERASVAEVLYVPSANSLAFGRGLLRRLRSNAVICVAGDGRDGQRLLPISFLGDTAPFATGMISLAKESGATIFPVFCVAAKDGKTRVVIEEGIHVSRDADRNRSVEDCVTRFARLLETHIRNHPGLVRNWSELGAPPPAKPAGC